MHSQARSASRSEIRGQQLALHPIQGVTTRTRRGDTPIHTSKSVDRCWELSSHRQAPQRSRERIPRLWTAVSAVSDRNEAAGLQFRQMSLQRRLRSACCPLHIGNSHILAAQDSDNIDPPRMRAGRDRSDHTVNGSPTRLQRVDNAIENRQRVRHGLVAAHAIEDTATGAPCQQKTSRVQGSQILTRGADGNAHAARDRGYP